MKRIRPAPMGRAFRYQRRLTHLIISVAERGGGATLVTKADEPAEEVKPAAKKAGAAKGTAKKAAATKAAAPKKKAAK
jgi:large subunit ribosomal protein L22